MSLVETTERFTRYCRTGQLDPELKLNPERAEVYLNHVRNVIEAALKKAYPLTCHLLTPEQWEELVESFLVDVDCATPFLWRMPQLLVDFVKKNHWANRFECSYLDDLVDFEWLEIEIFMMPDCPVQHSQTGNVLDNLLILNSESQIVTYTYPVYEKKPLPRPMKKGTYPLLAFRHPDDGEVYFVALSPFFNYVLELIENQRLTGRQALVQAAEKFNFHRDKVITAGEHFLRDLISQKALFYQSGETP